MPSSRRKKAKARQFWEIDILSDHGNMNVLLGDWNSNSLEGDLDNVINCPDRHQDFESLPNRGSSSQEIEIRNIDKRNGPIKQNGLEE